ncbi:LD-carboxypeptidase [Leptolyngbya sp. PCC 6406]|uniref:S66 peptidase family protein n=1 Tax=Leptolyngbya sp. PCC 6406 TaxID=1173264 RepID=UPI0002AC3FCC|nr:LD-carboxypeptidase [Leptolyngbya sp. PCC 6406]
MTFPSRRQLLQSLGALSALTALSLPSRATAATTIIKPPRLKPGDGIGIFSPAGATYRPEDLDIVMDAVRGLGLMPYPSPHVLERYGYLAGQDETRADDVNALFADERIAALLPLRGDWGSARILPYLDYDLIRNHPKIVTGFSDLTALLLGITAQTGLVTFHGPNGFTAWRPNQTDPFRQILFEGQRFSFANPVAAEDADRLMQTRFRINTITPGRARGRFYGGNLSVISGIVGSPYLPDLTGAILFLEDIGEAVYRVDRMLTQMKLAGALEGLAGFIFGQCVNCGPSGGYGGLTLEEVLADHIRPLGIPAWSNAALGHLEPILTLPLGTEVEIDATTGQITGLEAAVI